MDRRGGPGHPGEVCTGRSGRRLARPGVAPCVGLSQEPGTAGLRTWAHDRDRTELHRARRRLRRHPRPGRPALGRTDAVRGMDGPRRRRARHRHRARLPGAARPGQRAGAGPRRPGRRLARPTPRTSRTSWAATASPSGSSTATSGAPRSGRRCGTSTAGTSSSTAPTSPAPRDSRGRSPTPRPRVCTRLPTAGATRSTPRGSARCRAPCPTTRPRPIVCSPGWGAIRSGAASRPRPAVAAFSISSRACRA